MNLPQTGLPFARVGKSPAVLPEAVGLGAGWVACELLVWFLRPRSVGLPQLEERLDLGLGQWQQVRSRPEDNLAGQLEKHGVLDGVIHIVRDSHMTVIGHHHHIMVNHGLGHGPGEFG
jgi:hypothetical protein